MRVILVTIFLSLVSVSHAHVDRIIKLEGTTLIGLPDQYSNPTYSPETKTLSINDKTLVFPDCFNLDCDREKEMKISIVASWYHGPPLPPYISIQARSNRDQLQWKILIDLDTLLPIYVFDKENEESKELRQHFLEGSDCLESWKSNITNQPNQAVDTTAANARLFDDDTSKSTNPDVEAMTKAAVVSP